jgi:hypothetical protein
MSLVDRAKNILLKPTEEWPVIAAEPGDVVGLFKNYACILALVPLFAGILIATVLGALLASFMGGVVGSVGFGALVLSQVIGYVVGLALIFAIAFIVSSIAPSFNGKQDLFQAAKLIIYATTPVWLSYIFLIIPLLGLLVVLGAIAYAVYLVYLGAGPVLGIPQEKIAGFTVVTILVYLGVAIAYFVVLRLLSF